MTSNDYADLRRFILFASMLVAFRDGTPMQRTVTAHPTVTDTENTNA